MSAPDHPEPERLRRLRCEADRGVVLLNVLIIVAVASGIVVMMLSSQDAAVDRSLRLREAGQASAIARGGELSAVSALRRDALEGLASDNLKEPWAQVSQARTTIEGGSFALTISDAQARFNINTLVTGGGATSVGAVRSLCAYARVAPSDCERLIFHVQAAGPLGDFADLSVVGVDSEALRRLALLVTALPRSSGVNVNTADYAVLAAMLGNPAAARQLVSRRQAKGYLDGDDLSAARVILPPGLGFTSSLFWVDTTATVGDTPQRWISLLERRQTGQGVSVAAVSRKRVPAASDETPPA